MAPLQLLFFFLSLLLWPDGTIADDRTFVCPSLAGTYVPNSTYHNNLNLLLSDMALRTPIEMNLMTSQGTPPDQVFGVAQCVDRQTNSTCPTCSDTICKTCMDDARRDVPAVCPFFKEASGRFPNCLMGYSNKPITGPLVTGTPGLSEPSGTPQGSNGTATGKAATSVGHEKAQIEVYMLLLAMVGGAAAVLIVFGGIILCRRSRGKTDAEAPSHSPEAVLLEEDEGMLDAGTGPTTFTYKALQKATDNFAEKNLLGQGAFGRVFKGQLENGQVVAIKRVMCVDGGNKLNSSAARQLDNEVNVFTAIRHNNLVRMVGSCVRAETGEDSMLVCEFLPNGSLDRYFRTDSSEAGKLSWRIRFNVIMGLANGLVYLHNECSPAIIHRDLKMANILLDTNMEAKISDFGTARLFGDELTHKTATEHGGTRGYMPDEYNTLGIYSDKTDVYAYGQIVLEIVTGRMVPFFNRGGNLRKYVATLWNQRMATLAVDLRLAEEYIYEEVILCLYIGLCCTETEYTKRPRMANVNRELQSPQSIPEMLASTFSYPQPQPLNEEAVLAMSCGDDTSAAPGASSVDP